ncbi:hypothetical protein A1Q1_02922 [Trichosporon asahii var. asahii CBS 2479]|uniref:Extradiol ring-cleavage dioxygenase class III enzyme subunit B domain-containing protein n=1 Tax=Trichosporon asahii var. asahii (strain ATCC 90039 / CBS 2479 / JCM 2466 / KCTC 7840 / NBRC 103889/ NCYC 2677 / UAMH 7654) TaxID=1186058 RepID=J6EZ33_TRIAS|nr:hypothetical protein A1Q1_02922 [Trichosporon asahii var. asahii CBS 2479]EJT48112.1 hypothetical protein A1Q1_02922 [Trichosporon asahii var. asahii CBS 2479]
MPSSPAQQGQGNEQQSSSKKLLAAAVGILLAILLANLNKIKGFVRPSAATVNKLPPLQSRAMSSETYPRGQVYFLSHGGPPTMFDTASAPYKAWQKYGQAVVEQNPRGLVVVSAHWESNNDQILVNADQSNPLVYDFYGFPPEYYKQTFTSRGSDSMLSDVKTALTSANIDYATTKRGLDHGVWVPFKVAFNGSTSIPIIQVSLPGDGSPVSSAKLGRALASLRDKGYGIMGTGQAVHNLRDYMTGGRGEYGRPFLDAIQGALKSSDPVQGTVGLFRHPLYRAAHPSPEHLLPLAVAAAATDKQDRIRDIFVKDNGALGWGMWMWQPQAQAQTPVKA